MNTIENYYVQQARGGIPHFTGPSIQQGHGLGGIFSSLFRAAVPLFRKAAPIMKTAAKSVAKEAVRTGVHVLNDVLDGESVKAAVVNRGAEGAERIARKGARRLQRMVDGPKSIKRRRKTPRDIFSK